ncbi:MAG: DUF4169 family protein [Pseudomonadota bacterium]
MAEKPISLSKHRKARARAEKRAQADANAVKHGRSKAEKQRDRQHRLAEDRHLDGHRRDDDPER